MKTCFAILAARFLAVRALAFDIIMDDGTTYHDVTITATAS